ncbi:LTA synthase family protein [Cellvibrio sp. pealriver]|uniref:LTA synthase family protein n=1 Tax=Cellvibrio sp. pealriver TaxID=1622269 RepID=UPI00066FF10B|nr:LTA synthase family protein [Cellvibrio sp. pealriver]
MKRFLTPPQSWSGCLLFLLVCTHLIYHWTTAGIQWINYSLWIATHLGNLLIAILIGTHLQQQLNPQRSNALLLQILIIYLLLQLINYPLQNPILDHAQAFFWLEPQGAGLFAGAALMSLSGIIIFHHFQLKSLMHWRSLLLPVFLLVLMIALATRHNSFYLVGLSITITAGYFLLDKKIPWHSFISGVFSTPTSWFYISLIFTSIIIHWSPPFFADTRLLVKYLFCILIGALIVLLSATHSATTLWAWISGWLDWISGTQNQNNNAHEIASLNSALGDAPLWKRLNQSRSISTLLALSLAALRILLITTLTFLIIELPLRYWSIQAALYWVHDSIFFAAIAYGAIFLIYCSLRTFLSWHAATIMLFILAGLFSVTSEIKTRYLGVPLVPSDLNLINQALDSLVFIVGTAKAFLIFSALFILLSVFSLGVWRFAKRLANRNPWIGMRGALSLLAIFWLLQPGNWSLDEKVPNAWESGDSAGLYKKIGFVTGFLFRYQQFYIRPPQGFSKQSITALATQINIDLQDIHVQPQQITHQPRPHIIAIQSEAFWDPGLLHSELFPHGSPGNLSTICKHYTGYCQTGYVEVPVFGGSTANSEFEFLTGLSMRLLPHATVPFVHYVQKPIPSIGWRLQQANYHTLGIHPNGGWFWNRDKAYPSLGFQEFLDISAFDDAEKNQLYVTDRAINNVVYDRIEQAQQPQFIFAVTMANHAPFTDQRYSSLRDVAIDWEQLPMLTEEEQQAIKTYSIGVRESRLALEELIHTYSEENAPPVIIVFYGDHLPILGENYSIYHKAGFKTETMHDQFQEFFSTPYLVWSNQPLSTPLASSMTVSLLGQEVITLAGLNPSGLQQVVSQLQDSRFLRRPTRAQVLSNEQQVPLTEQQKIARQLYKHANFDALFDQSTPAFFGLMPPATIKPVADANP